MKNFNIRKLINDIHLWLGIGSGIVLFLVCFSGTILAFEHEIKEFFADEFKIDSTAGELQTLNNLTIALEESKQALVTGITIPTSTTEPYAFNVKKDPKERRGEQVLVDPYTTKTHKAEETGADEFLFTMFKLHRWLLLDTEVGRPIVGVATIIFFILSVTGIILWFPRKLKWKNFKPGFKIKTDANWKRINHDLHNTLGFYACIFLVIMALTGLCWSFEVYREGLGSLIGTKIFDRSSPEFKIDKTPKDSIISIDEVVVLANQNLDYEGELSVNFPNKKNDYFSIRKYNTSNWSPATYDRLYIDKKGTILAIEKFKDKPLNQKIASLIKPIHTGEVYGLFSKIIYFLACLIGTSLPITGTIIWLNKLKKKRKRVSS